MAVCLVRLPALCPCGAVELLYGVVMHYSIAAGAFAFWHCGVVAGDEQPFVGCVVVYRVKPSVFCVVRETVFQCMYTKLSVPLALFYYRAAPRSTAPHAMILSLRHGDLVLLKNNTSA